MTTEIIHRDATKLTVRTFIDLCCGTGALGLRLATGTEVKPLTPYMGWKKNLAQPILDAVGVKPLATRLIFNDLGPWGAVWQVLGRKERRAGVMSRLRSFCQEEPRPLYEKLKAEPVPLNPVEFAARFLTLQRWAYGAKPVQHKGGRWLLPGYCKASADGVAKRHNYGKVKPQLPSLTKILEGYTALPVIQASREDARTFSPAVEEGSLVYLDPNYRGRTGYTDALSRQDVVMLALRWAKRGCTVVVSEGEPLEELKGWETADLTARRGQVHKNFARDREEWITFWRSSHPFGVNLGALGRL